MISVANSFEYLIDPVDRVELDKTREIDRFSKKIVI